MKIKNISQVAYVIVELEDGRKFYIYPTDVYVFDDSNNFVKASDSDATEVENVYNELLKDILKK